MKTIFLCLSMMVSVALHAQTRKVSSESTQTFENIDCFGDKPLYVVNNKILPCDSVRFIKPDDIFEVQILRDTAGNTLHGPVGKNGTVIITTKKYAMHEKEKGERKQEEIKKP